VWLLPLRFCTARELSCNTVDSHGFEVNCKKLQGMAWVGAVVVAVAAAAGGPAATGGAVDRSVDPTAAGGCDAPKLSFHALQVMGRATRLVFALRMQDATRLHTCLTLRRFSRHLGCRSNPPLLALTVNIATCLCVCCDCSSLAATRTAGGLRSR
jgi:hypothetical protein